MTTVTYEGASKIGLESLLKQISQLNKHYEEIAKVTGENFNIFQVLGLTSDELSHSSFISTLLDPQGTHGKSHIFLKLFLDEVGIKDFSPENAKVETEKFIGKINKNHDNGGRIDVVITDKNSNNQILIENKIYAIDQEKQLFRYHESKNDAKLLYLTLNGIDASIQSLNGLTDNDYLRVSYRENIKNWLENCKKESTDNPLLRETIVQYINLINKLTGQSRSKTMGDDLINILMSDNNNIDSAFTIANNINILKKAIIENKLIPDLKKLSEKLKLKLDVKENNYSSPYWGFCFYKEDWKSLRMRFEFQTGDYKNFIYGYTNSQEIASEELIKRSKQLGNSSKAWLGYNSFSGYKDWDKDTFITIANNDNKNENNLIVAIEAKIKELLQLVEGLDI